MARDFRSDYRLLTSPFRVLPDFIIPGEAKCGTTSLYRYLVQHPDIFPADRKEPRNFIAHPASLANCRSHYPLSIRKWMHRTLTHRPFVTGEASAEYLSYPDACAHIASLLPETKIIILLREPVARAWSDYQMMRDTNIEKRSFEEIVEVSLRVLDDKALEQVAKDAMTREHSILRYVGRGIYHHALERWMRSFSNVRLMVLKSEDLFEHKGNTLNQIFTFLGVETAKIEDVRTRRQGKYAMPMPMKLAERLKQFYEPHNSKLCDLLRWKKSW